MSKKNKALKQLLKAQIQANAAASAQGKVISVAQPTIQPIPNQTATHTGPLTVGPVIVDKQASEFVLIKKDIRLSLLLISLVIICLFVIYFVDRANPFLLPLANKIFRLI
ncbi:MAG: hypothetical protein PHU42_02310 [Patescibacteria group bacterium]|nr:hypothetical protein [Patescibacteria group bacterium]